MDNNNKVIETEEEYYSRLAKEEMNRTNERELEEEIINDYYSSENKKD